MSPKMHSEDAAAAHSDEVEVNDPYEWISSLDLSRHTGRYLSAVGDDLVMVGDTLHEVVAAARKKHPGCIPFAMEIQEPIAISV